MALPFLLRYIASPFSLAHLPKIRQEKRNVSHPSFSIILPISFSQPMHDRLTGNTIFFQHPAPIKYCYRFRFFLVFAGVLRFSSLTPSALHRLSFEPISLLPFCHFIPIKLTRGDDGFLCEYRARQKDTWRRPEDDIEYLFNFILI
ncbi:hypothetical protein L2E82_42583 [Cichorium intybus]|uniref:Uncharacterized protein n=1 Tax=Cichorium intybus TaxID=13427 RepID=A0ACB8ZN65_CICIN|nr:hypothetical protein L2E82_42583 [Cichorium intybus]